MKIRSRFEILGSTNSNSDIQTKYGNVLNNIQETTANLVWRINRKTKNNWVSNDTTNLLKQRNQVKDNFKRNSTTENKKSWHTLNEQLDASYKNDKIKFLQDKLEQLKHAAASNQLRTTWSLIDEISGKRRYNNASKIKRTDGTKINPTTNSGTNGKHSLKIYSVSSQTSLKIMKQFHHPKKIYQCIKAL